MFRQLRHTKHHLADRKKRVRSRRLFLEPLEARRLLVVYVVTEYGSELGSLPWAAESANIHPGPDTIEFAVPTDPYYVDETVQLTESVTIEASGPEILHSSGGPIFSFGGPGDNTYTINGFYGAGIHFLDGDAGDTLNINDSTIAGNTRGAGITAHGGTLNISNSTISGNSGGDLFSGGGIEAEETVLNISNTTIRGNYTYDRGGGGIYARNSTVDIRDSVISNNDVAKWPVSLIMWPGGGLLVEGGTLQMSNSTVADNSAGTAGGLWLNDVQATLVNTTVSGNNLGVTTFEGIGGISSGGPAGHLSLINSTIVYNSAFQGSQVHAVSMVEYQNSIFAIASPGGPNWNFGGAASNLISLGHNISDDGTGNLTAVGDLPNTRPLLEQELADNGGPTPTHALLQFSPAIDAGADLSGQGVTTDQRGVARPYGPAYDIGAFEAQFEFDYGDAPDDADTPRYPTLWDNNGARHVIGPLYLGAKVDSELDGQPTNLADGDDNTGTNDDDGVFIIADMVATNDEATTASFEIVASEAGKLDAWIDFNQNDVFDHPDEHLGGGTSIQLIAGGRIIPFTVPAGAEAGQSFARFRISAGGGLLPSGAAGYGEVEDYVVTLLNGDAPNGANPVINLPELEARGLAFEVQRTGNTVTDALETISFSQSFSQPPLFLAGIETFNGGNPSGLRYQNLTADSVQVFVEEEQSSDAETTHPNTEVVGFVAIGLSGPLLGQLDQAVGVVAESGQVTFSQSDANAWQTVTLDNSFASPVVIAQPPSFNAAEPSTVRIRNITSDSFQIQLDEWEYLDGSHTTETISYLVMETGTHVLEDGTVARAGTIDANQDFTRGRFRPIFDTAPVVLSQSQTRNDPTAIVTRQQNVTGGGFDVRVQEEELEDGTHTTETIGYIAAELGTGVARTHLPGYLEVHAESHIYVTLDGLALFDAPGRAVNSLNIVGTTQDDTFGLAGIPGDSEVQVIFDGGAGEDVLRVTGFGQAIDLTTASNIQLVQLEMIDLTGSGANTLTLDAQSVIDVTEDANMLAVKCDIDETLNLGDGWSVSGTQVSDGVFYRVVEQGNAMLLLNGPAHWQNPLDPLDINASNSKEPLDVLLMINQLNNRQYTDAFGQLIDPAQLTPFPDFYYDSSGDGFASPLDALLLINFWNAHAGQMNGEASAGNLSLIGIPHAFATGQAGDLVRQGGEEKFDALAAAELPSRPDDDWPAVTVASHGDQREFTAAVDRLFAEDDDLLEDTQWDAWMSPIEDTPLL